MGIGRANPSCNDAWGDQVLMQWKRNIVSSIGCHAGKTSSMTCIDKYANGRMCSYENAMIDFSLYRDHKHAYPRKGATRRFEKGFFSLDCHNNDQDQDHSYLKFNHLFSSQVSFRIPMYII